MLDGDLALLYQVKTKVLNQAVRRNIERFPEDFMFQLTEEEYLAQRSQFVTFDNADRVKYVKYLPFVFTEQGVSMLSSVLRSKTAIQVNVEIMRAFVNIRRSLDIHKEITKRIDDLELKYDGNFKSVFEAIRQLMNIGAPPTRGKIMGLGSK